MKILLQNKEDPPSRVFPLALSYIYKIYVVWRACVIQGWHIFQGGLTNVDARMLNIFGGMTKIDWKRVYKIHTANNPLQNCS
jgi:hypothetical protein